MLIAQSAFVITGLAREAQAVVRDTPYPVARLAKDLGITPQEVILQMQAMGSRVSSNGKYVWLSAAKKLRDKIKSSGAPNDLNEVKTRTRAEPKQVNAAPEVAAESPPPAAAESPVAQPATPTKSPDLSTALNSLMMAAKEFATSHNEQIRIYNPAIQYLRQFQQKVQQSGRQGRKEDAEMIRQMDTLANTLKTVARQTKASEQTLQWISDQIQTIAGHFGRGKTPGPGASVHENWGRRAGEENKPPPNVMPPAQPVDRPRTKIVHQTISPYVGAKGMKKILTAAMSSARVIMGW